MKARVDWTGSAADGYAWGELKLGEESFSIVISEDDDEWCWRVAERYSDDDTDVCGGGCSSLAVAKREARGAAAKAETLAIDAWLALVEARDAKGGGA